MFVLPMLAGIAVGTLEEWLQWFIPGRVGDMRDVFLNIVAIVCGLLFSVGVDPPDAGAFRLRPGSLRRIGVVAAAVTLLFATFVYSVHLGVEIRDPEREVRSRYDAATLVRISQDRLVEWKDQPPIERPRSRSREDQYMSEGLLHVHERNRRWEAGDMAAAWSENLILEKYYAPVLDTPSYISRTGHRWPAEQRADAEQRLGVGTFCDGFVRESSRRRRGTPLHPHMVASRVLGGRPPGGVDHPHGMFRVRPWPGQIVIAAATGQTHADESVSELQRRVRSGVQVLRAVFRRPAWVDLPLCGDTAVE